jgi:tRNA-specific 2-thiouridylase
MKILLAMSGGLDSSASAHMLVKHHDTEGITLVFHEDIQVARTNLKICCSTEDVFDAKEICNSLNIKHHTVNLSKRFKRRVVLPFIDEYRTGKTPNPCGRCNRFLKIGYLVELLNKYNCDKLATGHYCRIIDGTLFKGKDLQKDQSYFLSMVKKEHLKKLYFPLGEMTKEEVRQFAKNNSLKVATKKESQELCFTGGLAPNKFVKKFIKEKQGFIKHINGHIFKRHDGLSSYTIGQRKGLGISWSQPLYVIALDYKNSTVIVGEKQYLEQKVPVKVSNFNKLSNFEGEITAAIRYNQTPQKIKKVEQISSNSYLFYFQNVISSVAPGQMLVAYNKDRVIGGGIIEK